jgi:DnaJ-domain-containing protein 1
MRRFKKMFKRTEPADPFAVFARTYGIKNPKDAPPPRAEPDEPQPDEPQPEAPDAPPPRAEPNEPQPVELGPTRAHQVLGVPLGASWQEVSQAYRRLALMHHPDRVAGMGLRARGYSEERMKEINAAYDELRRSGA